MTVKMITTEEIYEDFDTPKEVFNILLREKRQEIVDAYNELCEMDVEAEHGLIEEWIGYGSVTCYELPVLTTVGFNCAKIVLCLIKE